MRYYSIEIRNKGELIRPASLASLKLPETFASTVNGRNLPGALMVELNLLSYNYHSFEGSSYVRVWGVSLQELAQSNNLSGYDILVKAGMSKGLPLAKPSQAGIVAQGKIQQAFGNWIGTDQTLELQLLPGTGSGIGPRNYSFNWPANTPLSQAMETVLAVALPREYRVKMAISQDLKFGAAQWGTYGTLEDFAAAVFKISMMSQYQGIVPLSGGKYEGVRITIKDKTVLVYDGTQDYSTNSYNTPKQILFEDLIGQPTWMQGNELNFKCVMRADLSVGDYVKLPQGLSSPYVITTPNAAIPGAPSRNKLTFTGTFKITRMQHFGNSRQPDAASWCTVMNAALITSSLDASNPAQVGGQ